MSLAERLDTVRAAGAARLPKEAQAVMHAATDSLRASGILDRVPKAGAIAPGFTLPNTQGQPVDSAALLRRGPLVLTFYRGRW
jgi:hypothetical protein